MLLTDYIKIYESAIPESLCDEITELFNNSEAVVEDQLILDDGLNVRNNLELSLSSERDKEIHVTMVRITELALSKYQSELPIRTFPKEIGVEGFRIKKFRSGEEFNDHEAYHVDVNSYSSARRYLALVWCLNDVEIGGEIYFPHPNLRIKPRKGRLVLFPSLWMYPHSHERAVSNDQLLITSHLHYL